MRNRVVALVAVVASVAAFCLLFSSWQFSSPTSSVHLNALVAFIILNFAAESSYLRLRVGAAETSSSVAFIPFAASILIFDTGWAAFAAGTAVLGAEFLVKRKTPIKVLFNVSQQTTAVACGSWAYQLLGGTFSLHTFTLAPAATGVAVLVYFFLNSSAVSLAVAAADKIPLRDAWIRIAGASLAVDLVSSPLAPLLAYLYVRLELVGILMVVVPIFLVRHVYQLNMQLEQVNRDLLEMMVKAIEARDPYTSGHSQRVSQLAELLAKELGLGARFKEQIRTAALLHDVGKIHEQYAPLLRKEGRLDPTETALMQTHSTRSAELVATISGFRGVVEQAVRHHHENFDGTGYPHALAGEAIPLGARIIMIADTLDAMTTDRPYRKALTLSRVMDELQRYSGRQFDPKLVQIVLTSSVIRHSIMMRTGEAPATIPPSMKSLPRRFRVGVGI